MKIRAHLFKTDHLTSEDRRMFSPSLTIGPKKGYHWFGFWSYNPTGTIAHDFKARVYVLYLLGHKLEWLNPAGKREAATAPYAKCEDCGADNWTHYGKGQKVRVINHFGYPKIGHAK